MLKKIGKQNIYQIANEEIKKYIIESGLKPGDKLLSEQELAINLGISRTSLREALKGLQALGIIEVKPGDGIFLKEFNFDAILDNLSYSFIMNGAEVNELLMARKALECYFIKEAVNLANESNIKKINIIVEKMKEKALKKEDISELDEEFHIEIYEPIGNRVLSILISVFWRSLKAVRDKTLVIEPDIIGSYLRHEVILDCFKKKDVKNSLKAMEIHFESIERRLKKTSIK